MPYVTHRTPLIGALLSTAVLFGCGQSPSALLVSPVSPTTSQTRPAMAAQPIAAAGQSLNSQAATNQGLLAVRFSGASGYHVEATTGQIAAFRVTLSGAALSTPVVEEATSAQLASGQGQVVFQGIPGGNVSVLIEALDADGAVIGQTTTSAVVTAGQTTVVAATLQLIPTHVTSPDGNMNLNISVANGDTVVDPIASPTATTTAPVLGTDPSPLPTPSVSVVGTPSLSWLADGTMEATGSVQNTFAESKFVTLTACFYKKGLFGKHLVETSQVNLGLVQAKASVPFDVHSTKSVSSLFGDGSADVSISLQ